MAPTPNTRDAELDAAQDAPARVQNRNYFGQMTIDWDTYVLKKGEKRRLWSEQTDSEDDKRLIITFKLYPLPGAPSSTPIKKEVIASSREFDKFVRPSLAKLGVRLSALKEAYCQIALVPDGGTYMKKNEDGTTEPAPSTALTFAAVYPTLDAAQQAAAKLFKRDGTGPSGSGTAPTASTPAAPTPVADDVAQQALETLWQVSGKKEAAFMATLASLAPFKHLTLDSPEVKRITGTF